MHIPSTVYVKAHSLPPVALPTAPPISILANFGEGGQTGTQGDGESLKFSIKLRVNTITISFKKSRYII